MLSLVEIFFKSLNPLQDLLSSWNAVISTNERNLILTGHAIFKLHYNQIYQLKMTIISLQEKLTQNGWQTFRGHNR